MVHTQITQRYYTRGLFFHFEAGIADSIYSFKRKKIVLVTETEHHWELRIHVFFLMK